MAQDELNKIPESVAEGIAREYGKDLVIIMSWDATNEYQLTSHGNDLLPLGVAARNRQKQAVRYMAIEEDRERVIRQHHPEIPENAIISPPRRREYQELEERYNTDEEYRERIDRRYNEILAEMEG